MSSLLASAPALVPTATTVGNPAINIAIFALFVVVTLAIVIRASRNNRSAAEYYAGGRAFTGRQNGIAIAGDYLSAASFLGIAGAIAINGYDGFLYSIGFLVAWLVALLLVAELLRNVGKYTMADVLSFRLRQRPVRIAAAISTLVVSFFYLLAQMAGAGGLVALLLGIEGAVGAAARHRRRRPHHDLLRHLRRHEGHDVGADHQGRAAHHRRRHHDDLGRSACSASASRTCSVRPPQASQDAGGKDLLQPGLQYKNPIDFISLSMALVLGTAGLPHVLMRFYTVPTSREARRSVVWAIWLIGIFYLFTLVLGFGAAELVGASAIKNAPGGVNSAAPLLAFELGGEILLGIISAVAFATILAVVAGLTITASASLSHDIYNTVVKKGTATPEEEVKVARIAALVLGALAIIGGIFALGQNIAFLVALAFAVAASANLPTILYSLFWKRFNTRGALWSIYGGLISAITLIIFSPVVSGKPVDPVTGKSPSMLQGVDFHWFPLDNPGIISIPLGFILGYIGTVTSKEYSAAKYAEMEVRSLTGHGAEKASSH